MMLPGNRKLVLRVIEENPGITLWQIRTKLKEIHKDWHPSRYVLIRHVLGLASANLVKVKPKPSIDKLKKLIHDYKELRNKKGQGIPRIRGALVRSVAKTKDLPLKRTQSVVRKLAHYYPSSIELRNFLEDGLNLQINSKRWRASEKLITELSSGLVKIETTDRGKEISVLRHVLKEEPKKYDSCVLDKLKSEEKRIADLAQRFSHQTRCYPVTK